jgi:hypothetical protein
MLGKGDPGVATVGLEAGGHHYAECGGHPTGGTVATLFAVRGFPLRSEAKYAAQAAVDLMHEGRG